MRGSIVSNNQPEPIGTHFQRDEVRPGRARFEPHLTAYLLVCLYIAAFFTQQYLIDEILPLPIIRFVSYLALLSLAVEKTVTRRNFVLSWPESHALLAFLGACAISSFTAFWPRMAVDTIIVFLKYLAIYFLMVNTVTSEKRLRGLIWLIVLTGLFPVIGTINNYRIGWIWQDRAFWHGIFGNPNFLATTLVVVIPLVMSLRMDLRKGTRVLVWGMTGLYSLAVFLTYSRGGLLGLMAVLVLIIKDLRKPMLRISALALCLAGLVLAVNSWGRSETFNIDLEEDESAKARMEAYEAGWEMFMDHPVLGVGPGCSGLGLGEYGNKHMVHNTILQALSETGLLGTSFFLIAVFASLLHCRRIERAPPEMLSPSLRSYAGGVKVALWGFLACGLTGGDLFAFPAYMLFGLASAARRIANDQLAGTL